MRVLITGGAGFLGSHLTASHIVSGDDVTVLDDLSSGGSPPPGAIFLHGDVRDRGGIGLASFDLIYHLAAIPSPPQYFADPVRTLQVGAEGTQNLLDLALQHGARFVYASTSEVYGDPLQHPQREDYRGNVDITNPRACYDEGKRYGEALVHAYHRQRGVDTRIARIFNTYGPGMLPDDGRVVTNFLTQAMNGEPLTIHGDGTQTRSFCYVTDMISGLRLLAESLHSEPINLGMPYETTVAGLATLVELIVPTSADHRVQAEPYPGDPARRLPAISKARLLLGWSPNVALRTGLELTYQYLRDSRRTVAVGDAS